MTGKLILPFDYLEQIDAPLIFLAGPITGAYDWQSQAIDIIQETAPDLYIASPRRKTSFRDYPEGFRIKMFNEQVDWETYHLNQAAENGSILFWLAKEFEHSCDSAYAQTTRWELAEWKVKHERDGARLALGIEDGFSGRRYIKRRIMQDSPGIRIHSTLEDTCNEAIGLARLRK